MRKFRLKCLYKLTYFWKKDFSSTGGTAENFSSSFSSGNTGPSIIWVSTKSISVGELLVFDFLKSESGKLNLDS